MRQARQGTAMARDARAVLDANGQYWPVLDWDEWKETGATLALWMQVIGKIRLALAPRVNHWWHVALYPTVSGLTTSPMPYGHRMLQIDFDFLTHQLILQTSDGLWESLELSAMSVSQFYHQVMAHLQQLGMPMTLFTRPSEVPNPIPFELDKRPGAYQPEVAKRFWLILLNVQRVLTQFRAGFLGKVSPVHFFWGGMDLVVTRFSGRRAPRHGSVPNIPDAVVQAAYSHEVSSCGFWAGGEHLPEPMFYSYAYPMPPGMAKATVLPSQAYFHEGLGEFVLPYEAVRQANEPDACLLSFLQTTYDAAANLGHWDRLALEAQNASI